MRGFATGDLRQAFADIEMLKEHATKADSALFHVQIRGAHGEGKKLTRAQWLEIADGCDTALGRVMTQRRGSNKQGSRWHRSGGGICRSGGKQGRRPDTHFKSSLLQGLMTGQSASGAVRGGHFLGMPYSRDRAAM